MNSVRLNLFLPVQKLICREGKKIKGLFCFKTHGASKNVYKVLKSC